MATRHAWVFGFATVGRGAGEVRRRDDEESTRRAGRTIRINWVGTRTLERARQGARGITDVQFSDDPAAVARHPDVDIVCELIGGIEPARSLILDAIAHGKHIVTANKALLAQSGHEPSAAAHDQGVMVAFDAAVARAPPTTHRPPTDLTTTRRD